MQIQDPSFRNLEKVLSWGMVSSAYSNVYRPRTVEEIRQVFAMAAEKGLTIGLRGTGCSYGDASLNNDQILLDFTAMDQILSWDPDTGLVIAEPGVSIQKLWQSTLEDGWWPPVVSGTMYPTLGGVLAMNIHGKNNFKVGPIGEHVLSFDLMVPDGSIKTCSRTENKDLFFSAISGFGMLGVFTKITLQMKKVYSGFVSVEPIVTATLEEMFTRFEERLPQSDYLVGWIDCMSKGAAIGRGVIHQANYLEPGQDPDPKESLRVSNQGLPDRIMGIVPSSLVYLFLKPFVNNFGMRLVNAAKWWSAKISLQGHRYLQSHAAFAFLLDYVPNWKLSYKPLGLIQWQSFVPKERALEAFRDLILACQRAGHPPYLGVFKKHRPDEFLLSHAVDGYSLALDFRVTETNRAGLWLLTQELEQIILRAGGRFYFAKDSTLRPETVREFLGEKAIAAFTALKAVCDPAGRLQTNLSRRLFGFKPAKEMADSRPKMARLG